MLPYIIIITAMVFIILNRYDLEENVAGRINKFTDGGIWTVNEAV